MRYATLTISVLIIVAVLIPGSNLPDISIGGWDKVIHLAMFFMWALAVRYDVGPDRKFIFLKYLVLGVIFSALTEVLQIVIEGRSFDVYDMFADLVGLVAGLLAGKPIIKLLEKVGL